ncbi:MAG: type II toxin-antitoxin system Phd/YefM family antitoxin [Proteobacteria bacterium]|nr:type II toxin-antitoxin system Phd/YefM family antitoxin [Pseudomonadota bacterium]
MRSLSLATIKARFSEMVNLAEHRNERVVIEKRNNPVAVIIGYEDYQKLKTLEDIYESKVLEEILKNDRFYTLEEVAKRVNIEL